MKNKLNFISFLLLIGALAASHSRSIKKKNMTQALCVGSKWLQVGSVRFWQRKSCDKRRQYGPRQATANGEEEKEPEDTPGTSRMPSTLNLDELLPSLEAGPVRGPKYSPNFGYEPYWPKGDWVFDRDDGTKDKNIYMCGVRCPKVYTEFGKICGRNKNGGYKTFPNYCQLKNEDCSNIQRWAALYQGECTNDYVPIDPGGDGIKARIKNHEENFLKEYISTRRTTNYTLPAGYTYTGTVPADFDGAPHY